VHHDARVSHVEAILARGDRRLAPALALACERGFCFDAWDEYFRYDEWIKVFEDCEIDYNFYSNRAWGEDEVLPWDVIDCGVDKSFFLSERHKAYGEKTTGNCKDGCAGCGAWKMGGKTTWCPGRSE
jgi:hypothetical protein